METLTNLFNDFNNIFSNVGNLEKVSFQEPIVVNMDIEFIDLCS